MDILEKARILGTAANYDTVCGSPRSTRWANDSLTTTLSSFIHKACSENYGCKIFKVLQTNKCIHDCKYCVNSCKNKKALTEFQPQELAKVFMYSVCRGLANGLFLSSGVSKDPDETTGKMLETVKILKTKHNFKGYIHFKILPGVKKDLVKQVSFLSERLSINIEAPSKSRLSDISSNKDIISI